MSTALSKYAERFDALSLRERVLVFAGCVALVGAILFVLLLEPMARERKQLGQQIAQQQQVLSTTRAAVQALRSDQRDPNATARARREALTREQAAADRELELAARGLVAPERMAALIESLIGREARLQLVGLRTLAPTPLLGAAHTGPDRVPAGKAQASARAPQAGAAEGDAPGLYKHGIELTLQGGYHELAAYVSRLERMPWKMYWAKAVLDAERYPQVSLTLTLFTLSPERSWLRL